jgi:hypothetical protein
VEVSEDKAEPILAELPETMYTEAELSEMDLELQDWTPVDKVLWQCLGDTLHRHQNDGTNLTGNIAGYNDTK